ncbi:hypothetical protein FQ087_01125 [Sporosarcina sp. ANT_H38]|uniref:hypothetical protein n=1 Tax=Sporosarcina sp. ANT_H38 TaxID=2597358 RepID=UPI0011F36D50|nr:hypothetical protein [Sporosarcina sp. ANT_H38]KAA0964958.1 hypothetical protein FQ087_01125 [Sporosarcina sp. ANT_H38]
MGLFINKNGHPDVFKNNADILGWNQEHYKIDPVAEWMKEQREMTHAVGDQFNIMETLLKQQKNAQSNQLKSIHNRLNEIKESDFRHEKFGNDVMESLKKVETKNKLLQRTLMHEQIINRELIGKVNEVSQSNEEIVNRMETLTSADEEIMVKMNEQLDYQKLLSEQILEQKDVQNDMLSRLDNQEGLLGKVIRQLDYLRSVLFERTNFLSEKIEGGYSITSSYISKLIARSDQGSARFMLSQKKEEKGEHLD